jgi:hypothetical protein
MLFKACWTPARANAKAIIFVNALDRKFFKLFRIASVVMLPYFSLLLAGNAVLLVVKAWSRLAS